MEIINDFSTSVRKSLEEIDKNWETYPGVIVCGTHDPRNVEETIDRLKRAREEKTPTLGICFGMQLMAVEYARNVLGWDGAHTAEVDPDTPYPVLKKLEVLRVGLRDVEHSGAVWPESHWHNYAFNPDYNADFAVDWTLTHTGQILEVMELAGHPHYIGVQFHPEYQSSPGLPHPILERFLKSFHHEQLEM